MSRFYISMVTWVLIATMPYENNLLSYKKYYFNQKLALNKPYDDFEHGKT